VRHPRFSRVTAILAVAAVAVVAQSSSPRGATAASSADGLPLTMLWAWERPEHLDFLDPATTGVAYLNRTITVAADSVGTHPRLQPLTVPPGTRMVAVVRIETSTRSLWSDSLRRRLANEALAAADGGVAAVQIDFDATVSERSSYRRLIMDVRAALPRTVGLQITALASWCLGDPWLQDLPVDDAIPMLFRMGPDARTVARRLVDGGDFSAPMCRHSVGISTDEPLPSLPRGRRQYIFTPRPWTANAFHLIVQEPDR